MTGDLLFEVVVKDIKDEVVTLSVTTTDGIEVNTQTVRLIKDDTFRLTIKFVYKKDAIKHLIYRLLRKDTVH